LADITFLIFDMDDVLYDFDHQRRLTLLEDLTGRPAAEIDAAVWGGPHEDAAEAGDPETAEGYLQQFASLLGYPIDFETWAEIRRQMMRPRPEVLDLVRRLKSQADLALLTNNGMLLKAAMPVCAPEVIGIFGKKTHVSAEFGARKPDTAVYERICARYGHAPGQSLFFDDKLENIDGARQAGLLGHHYQDFSGLLACLNDHGFKTI